MEFFCKRTYKTDNVDKAFNSPFFTGRHANNSFRFIHISIQLSPDALRTFLSFSF